MSSLDTILLTAFCYNTIARVVVARTRTGSVPNAEPAAESAEENGAPPQAEPAYFQSLGVT